MKDEDIFVWVGLWFVNWLFFILEEMVIEYFEYDFEYVVLFKYILLRIKIFVNGIIYLVGGE